MTKQERMAELIEQIRVLTRKEEIFLIQASQIGCEAARLRAKEERILTEAKKCEVQRYALALEYNRIKNPCPRIITAAEEKIGRKLTTDEVLEIERLYAQKITRDSSVTAH